VKCVLHHRPVNRQFVCWETDIRFTGWEGRGGKTCHSRSVAHLASYPVGLHDFLRGVKALEREADDSSPSCPVL